MPMSVALAARHVFSNLQDEVQDLDLMTFCARMIIAMSHPDMEIDSCPIAIVARLLEEEEEDNKTSGLDASVQDASVQDACA